MNPFFFRACHWCGTNIDYVKKQISLVLPRTKSAGPLKKQLWFLQEPQLVLSRTYLKSLYQFFIFSSNLAWKFPEPKLVLSRMRIGCALKVESKLVSIKPDVVPQRSKNDFSKNQMGFLQQPITGFHADLKWFRLQELKRVSEILPKTWDDSTKNWMNFLKKNWFGSYENPRWSNRNWNLFFRKPDFILHRTIVCSSRNLSWYCWQPRIAFFKNPIMVLSRSWAPRIRFGSP